MKIYYGGCISPAEFDFVIACFAPNGKEAKQLMWKHGELAEECEGEWISARVIRKPEHDHLLGNDGRTDAHVIQDDETYREMGWMIDGDSRCDSCGLADYDGKWPVCSDCQQCEECGHDENCEICTEDRESGS